jgi:hypothetical protein
VSSQKRRNRLTSRITETWRSWLSWMRWRQRREALRLQREEILLARLQATLQVLLREQLWELGIPMAEALGRLDHHQQLTRKRVQVMQAQQVEMRNQQEELLLEVLKSLQPSAREQLHPLIGQPMPPLYSPSSVS